MRGWHQTSCTRMSHSTTSQTSPPPVCIGKMLNIPDVHVTFYLFCGKIVLGSNLLTVLYGHGVLLLNFNLNDLLLNKLLLVDHYLIISRFVCHIMFDSYNVNKNVNYANNVAGLRTLCLAMADISEEFYDEWKHTYYKASTSIHDREKKLDEAAELIERVIYSPAHLTLFYLLLHFTKHTSKTHSQIQKLKNQSPEKHIRFVIVGRGRPDCHY